MAAAAKECAEEPACRGRFISFEGGEGAGKSTQLRRLGERLQASGLDVVCTREPGGSARAELIRAVLLSGGAKRFGALAETVLFAAARADHVDRMIAPALSRGTYVLCDRFFDSTRVYQGAVAGLPAAILAALDAASVGATRPDLTIMLDVPAATGLGRATRRRTRLGEAADRFEAESDAYHAAVRTAFVDIARAEPGRCVVVEGIGLPNEVAARVWGAVEPRLAAWGRAARVT